MTCDDRVAIELLITGVIFLDHLARQHFEIADHGGGFGAAMRLDEPADDVDAVRAELLGAVEHRIRLAAACDSAEIHDQAAVARTRKVGAFERYRYIALAEKRLRRIDDEYVAIQVPVHQVPCRSATRHDD